MPNRKKQKPVQARKKDNWFLFIRRKFFFLGALVIAALLFSSQVNLTADYRKAKNVLGDEDKTSEAQKHAIEQQQETQKHANEQLRQNTQITGQSQSGGRETQVQGPNGVVLKTKVEDSGARKIEGVSGGIQFKYEVENGKAQLQAEDSSGHKISTQEAEKKRLETSLKNEGVEVSTEDGEFKFGKNNTHALTHFPLSVDSETHNLTVTTPAGSKAVTVLPDQAVKNFLNFSGLAANATAAAGASEPIIQSVDLRLNNNDLVYEVKVEQPQKLFGVIPMTTSATTSVSAQNGMVLTQTQTLLNRLINLLLF